jgi:DNA-binding NtrC family response regulator
LSVNSIADVTNTMNVLIVDDEYDLRDIVTSLVSELGYTCKSANDGYQAVKMLEKEHFHLVLSDIHMPRMNGMELLDRVIVDFPGTRILLFTGYGSISNAVDAIKKGAIGYITKPINFDVLTKQLKNLAEELNLSSTGGQLMTEMFRRFQSGLPASKNKKMNHLIQLTINRLAAADTTVMIGGETGTGKELTAALLHNFSPRSNEPFVKINSSAIPDTLLESELFGHAKGAFTGASVERKGKIAVAEGGTLFLDEIAEISLQMQAKLLRVLQEREYEALGSNRTRKANIRLITATNHNLKAEVDAGRFRRDLYYRLNVIEIILPPLRERMEDLPELIEFTLGRLSAKMARPQPGVTLEFLASLEKYHWPGNIRELENLLERCMLTVRGEMIDENDLPPEFAQNGSGQSSLMQSTSNSPGLAGLTLEEARGSFERQFLHQVLQEEEGNVSASSRRLGIARKNLQQKLKKFGMEAATYKLRGITNDNKPK